MKALNDCMLIQSLPKHSLKQVKTLKIISGNSRSAYNLETIETSTPFFLEVLRYLPLLKKGHSLDEEQTLCINSLLVHVLSGQITERNSQLIYNQVATKVQAVVVLVNLLKSGALQLSPEEVYEYVRVLSPLVSYGVIELNAQILSFYEVVASKADLLNDYYRQTIRILTSL